MPHARVNENDTTRVLQVLGHIKTILILFLGFVLFDDMPTPLQASGMLLAVGGMVYYGLKL